MKYLGLQMLLILLTTSCAPMLGASYHHPQKIWDAKTANMKKGDAMPMDQVPRINPVNNNRDVIIRLFEDEILAPTGVYLSSEEKAFTPTTEMYYTPQTSNKLFDYFYGWMIKAGVRVYQQYDHSTPIMCQDPSRVAEARIVEVYISHAELHRWMYKAGEIVDLMRITYNYRWKDCDGKIVYKSQDVTHDLMSSSNADELNIAAGLMAKEILSKM